jgi:hypothetical protein
MARHDRLEIDSALLCEQCGYPLAGLDRSGACPECGVAVSRSLPAHRSGSPWQRTPSFPSWVHTVALVLQRPRACWSDIRVESGRSKALALVCAVVAGFLALCPAATLHWRAGATMDAIALLLYGAVGGGAMLFVLTWIERVGIVFFGRRRGWRTTKRVAWAVCGHASVGWLVCGAIVSFAWGLGVVRGGVWMRDLQIKGVVFATLTPSSLVVVGAFILGMLVFETLVYLGFRSMRYANPPEAGANATGDAGELGSEP